ncbi:BON domain-containing protein [Tumidithrix helvetica PCC 7403]|uniref:BON domain-containing protein n=1 Tax=Tumidithrix helvetica TaxID=3457545 RepID=UPI003C891FFF
MTAIHTIKRTDAELKADILSELEYEPSVKVTDIGVLVNNGTVTLNGYATSYDEKWKAVRAVKRIVGVKAIADDIEIKFLNPQHHIDGDIAAAAVNHIEWCKSIPKDSVKVTVSKGWITLDGEVEWGYQKNDAEDVVQLLSGVQGVSNLISIKPKLTATAVETAIKSAFKRNALVDATMIHVKTDGGKITLSGNVRNFTELEEAERVAWAAPGVLHVDNQLTMMEFTDSH